MTVDADAIVIGAGLAGLVAAVELIDAGKKVIVVDQEPEQAIGGQAFWSFGGLFLVDTPEQRLMGIRDSLALARDDWMATAAFDRAEDEWPRRWAEAYLHFAAGEKRTWLRERGIHLFPVVGWAERGGQNATGHGNSVPRFHVTWGTGPGLIEPFVRRVLEASRQHQAALRFRHRVDELIKSDGRVSGVRGKVLEPSTVERGHKSSRTVIGDFAFRARAVIVCSGGIGANHELVRANWPRNLGEPPKHMLKGVPDHVDGRMLAIAEAAGGTTINRDRMWHYVEGVRNWNPIWTSHGIRILPGPSSLWLDARGQRLPPPLYPGFDTLGTLRHIMGTGYDYSWFILNHSIARREFTLSGSEQNPDVTNKRLGRVLRQMAIRRVSKSVQAFLDQGEDFIVEKDLTTLVARMNALADGPPLLSFEQIGNEIVARDRQIANPFGKDMQITAIRGARRYIGDKLMRTAAPHRLLDPSAGPLIAVRLRLLSRKTLGGLQTDLDSRVLAADGGPVPGLYAAGEVAGFGGGGMHGSAALEGTFLGGCIFSGRAAGRAAAKAT